MMKKILFIILTSFLLFGCGKVGPLSLPEDKLDKSVISFPCDKACEKRFEEEKKRQQSVTLQTE
jgi:predicted small lipoprotein YifL|tara:strand:- start:251 stop:442 length:192 start_codon:yes stop_codon:yes gene_type:complete